MKYMKKYMMTFLLVCSTTTAAVRAQGNETSVRERSRNAVYLEVLGNAQWYSVNYDRILGESWALRIGASFVPYSVENNNGNGRYRMSDITVPLTLSYLLNFGRSAHNIEIGVGASPRWTIVSFEGALSDRAAYPAYTRNVLTTFGSAIIGYRFQPLESGFMFRLALTPSIEVVPGVTPPLAPPQILYGGLSIGYTF